MKLKVESISEQIEQLKVLSFIVTYGAVSYIELNRNPDYNLIERQLTDSEIRTLNNWSEQIERLNKEMRSTCEHCLTDQYCRECSEDHIGEPYEKETN